MKYPERPEEISAFDAKTRLSELLRETEHGRSYLIRRRGKAVARLVPVLSERAAMRDVVAKFDAIRRRIRGKVSIKDLVAQGRR